MLFITGLYLLYETGKEEKTKTADSTCTARDINDFTKSRVQISLNGRGRKKKEEKITNEYMQNFFNFFKIKVSTWPPKGYPMLHCCKMGFLVFCRRYSSSRESYHENFIISPVSTN